MSCTKCDREAVMSATYSGSQLCEHHFCRSVERRVRARIREDNLLDSSATPETPETWLVGLSGGKDSVVLTQILHETFEEDPRIELVALTVHEGIEGYRDASLEACAELVDILEIEHVTVSYAEEFGVEMDDVAEDDPMNMAPCAYCGVFRRDVLSGYADEYEADKLLTGHNLDDEAETALMNIFEGNVSQMATQFDASLGRFGTADAEEPAIEDSEPPIRSVPDDMIPRAKPLRDVPEKEVGLYAQLRDLPVHTAACPHASESFRAEIQELMLELESNHPGTRHSIMAGYEEIAGLASLRERKTTEEDVEYGDCERCGSPTSQEETCRKCTLLAAVGTT